MPQQLNNIKTTLLYSLVDFRKMFNINRLISFTAFFFFVWGNLIFHICFGHTCNPEVILISYERQSWNNLFHPGKRRYSLAGQLLLLLADVKKAFSYKYFQQNNLLKTNNFLSPFLVWMDLVAWKDKKMIIINNKLLLCILLL